MRKNKNETYVGTRLRVQLSGERSNGGWVRTQRDCHRMTVACALHRLLCQGAGSAVQFLCLLAFFVEMPLSFSKPHEPFSASGLYGKDKHSTRNASKHKN
jgi:hypothetical protein